MERVNTLINKLQQQLNANENARQLMQTAQLLVAELSYTQEIEQVGKVSVMMPNFYVTKEELKEEIKIEVAEKPAPIIEAAAKTKVEITPEPVVEIIAEPVIYAIPETVVEINTELKIEEIKPVKGVSIENRKVLHTLLVDDFEDIPTFATQNKKEAVQVNDMVQTGKQSLNEILKEHKKEVVTTLVDAPVKDLRKAIGVNDKYVFINELFSGDEAMYERSIKTINNFSVYPEAEQWIKRELYTKLCWLDNSSSVDSFYNAVRRRFV